jgi:hypothetical protein
MICTLNKYYSGDQIENNDMGGACGTHGGRRGAYRALMGRPDGKKPLGRRARRCEDNIKIDVEEVGWGTWNGLIRLGIRTGGGLLRIR